MPRTKGSKNCPKITNDFASKIAEKKESTASLTSEITSTTANIDTLKADLKEKKTALKTFILFPMLATLFSYGLGSIYKRVHILLEM